MSKQSTYRRADGIAFVWNGSKTVNVYRAGVNIDCFSLDYGKDYTVREIATLCEEWHPYY